MKAQLSSKPYLINRVDRNGWTLLHWAAHLGNLEAAKLLLDMGAEVNSIDNFGNLPLHLACARGDIEMIKLLVERGSRTSYSNLRGETPLSKLREKWGEIERSSLTSPESALDAVSVLRKLGASYELEALIEKAALRFDDLELILRLSEVADSDAYLRKRIQRLLSLGSLEEALLLLDKYPFNMSLDFLESVFSLMITEFSDEKVEIALRALASRDDVKPLLGELAFIAIKHKRKRVLEMLLSLGLSPSYSSNGRSLIDEAMMTGDHQIVKLLRELSGTREESSLEASEVNRVASLNLTDEQRKIVAYKGPALKVIALAGTGKSSTLLSFAKSRGDRRGLYITFNKAMELSAKERASELGVHRLEIRTVHSLAYNAVRKHLGNFKVQELSIYQLAKRYRMSVLDAYGTLTALNKFCYSDFDTFEELFRFFKESKWLLPIGDLSEFKVLSEEKYYQYAEQLYNELLRGGTYTHDLYLKEFERRLKRGELELYYDYLVLDEAQDSNPVTLSIFLNINAEQKLMVGDRYQRIYGFRGNIDILDYFPAEELYLTHSFRHSEEVAEIANKFLRDFLGSKISIVPYSEGKRGIVTIAYLTRTNSALIDLILSMDDFSLIRDPKEIFRPIFEIMAVDVYNRDLAFKYFKPFELQLYRYYDSLKELYLDALSVNDLEVLSAISIYHRFGVKRVIAAYERAMRSLSKSSNIFLATIHSVKGLEFDKVVLVEFPSITELILKSLLEQAVHRKQVYSDLRDLYDKLDPMTQEELHLYYVAITRAKDEFRDETGNMEVVFRSQEELRRDLERAYLNRLKEKSIPVDSLREAGIKEGVELRLPLIDMTDLVLALTERESALEDLLREGEGERWRKLPPEVLEDISFIINEQATERWRGKKWLKQMREHNLILERLKRGTLSEVKKLLDKYSWELRAITDGDISELSFLLASGDDGRVYLIISPQSEFKERGIRIRRRRKTESLEELKMRLGIDDKFKELLLRAVLRRRREKKSPS